MAKKDSLETYIKKSQKGDKDAYRKVIAELYSEIYNLSAFIYDDDETREKLTKHLFIKAFKSIADFDSEECDIHLWMAREATREIYNVAVKRGDNIFSNEIEQRDYSFESIEEDDELGEASAEFNESFLTEEGFDPATEFAANLTIGEKIIYLLYCYEGYTIDEIESIIEIDSSFIMSEIAGMRDGVLAEYAPIKAENDGVVEDVLADSAIAAGYGNDDGDYDSDGFEYESEDEYDEEQDDDDYEDDQDDEYVFDSGRRGKSSYVDDRNKKKYAIGKLRLTEKELKGLIIGVAAAVILIIVIVIVVVASGHNRNRNNNTSTKAVTKPQVTNTTTVQPSTAQEETTTEEETTTKKKVQQGTQPQVEINTTTAAPTPAPEQKPINPPVNVKNPGSGDSGNSNMGSGDSGNSNPGSGDSGNSNPGSGDSGSGNSGSGNSGSGNSGSGNSGSGNSGSGGSGSGNSGSGNSGSGNSGSGNSGSGGSGSGGSGSGGSGSGNSGSGDSGSGDSGSDNSGSGNSGSNNSGISNLENNNAIGGDNTSNNSGNTSNESSNTGNNVQQQ